MPLIGTDEHVFIPGKTGSGKSFLAEVYLRGFTHVVKLDTKGEVFERRKKKQPIWSGLQEGKDFTVIERLQEIDKVKTPKIIYAPIFEEQTLEYYDSLLKWVYLRENTTIWIDELMSIAEVSKYPPYLKACMTRGRSKDVSVWALTQRPMDIPTIVLANTTHFFVFNLNLPQDRKKMAETTGMMEFLESPGYRNFWYYKDGEEEAVKATLDV
jgi:hypothetical protein